MQSNNNADHYISRLYTSASRIPADSFRVWAIEQLQAVVPFDAAFWGTGRLADLTPHYVVNVGLDDNYQQILAETIDINPIKGPVLSQLGEPVKMSEVYPDQEFYASELYQKLFQPYGIERVLASGHKNERSGLFTLLSLYRYDRDNDFTDEEKDLIGRLIFHMMEAASFAFFLDLEDSKKQSLTDNGTCQKAWAICDCSGYYLQVQDRFLNFIETYCEGAQPQQLPFDISLLEDGQDTVVHGLAFNVQARDKLFLIGIRPANAFDQLTEREREVIEWTTQGLSYKEVGKKIGLAPSTVSNHLYRVYNKLGISSKTELVQLKSQVEAD